MMYLLLTWLLAPLALLRLARGRALISPQNILLIQTAKIGDYICTTPLIRALRSTYPDARLILLVNPLSEPLARYQPGVDEVLTLVGGRISGFSGRLALYRMLRHKRLDTTICISPNQAFLLIPFLAGVRWRASILPNFGGSSYQLATPFLNATETHRQGRMMVETGMALLQRLGVKASLPDKEIVAAPCAEQRVMSVFPMLATGSWIGLGVSSGNKLKELGHNQLADLIDRLLALDHGIVLIGSAAEQRLAGELCRAGNSSRLIDSTGRVPLEDLAALIDRLSLYVGVDSGITYLADARGIPVIDIMGPADPEDQRPTGSQAIVIRTELACAPCSHSFLAPYDCAIGTRACVLQTNIQRVAKSAQEMLRNENRSF